MRRQSLRAEGGGGVGGWGGEGDGHLEPMPGVSVPRPDLPCVPILLSTDTSVEDSVHPTQDGADQDATSVLWRLLSSEALSPSPGDFPHTRQSEPPAFEEATPQIPRMPASGIPGEAQQGADSKDFSSPQSCLC